MSNTIRGTVQKVYEKNGFFYLIIDDTFYGFGKRRPSAKQGDYVTFAADQNGKYWNADDKTLIVTESTSDSVPSKASTPYTDKTSKDDYWKEREKRDIVIQGKIQMQSARNSAIEFVKLALSADAIKLPAKQADKADALFEFVNHYASLFNDITNGKEATQSSSDETVEHNTDENDYE